MPITIIHAIETTHPGATYVHEALTWNGDRLALRLEGHRWKTITRDIESKRSTLREPIWLSPSRAVDWLQTHDPKECPNAREARRKIDHAIELHGPDVPDGSVPVASSSNERYQTDLYYVGHTLYRTPLGNWILKDRSGAGCERDPLKALSDDDAHRWIVEVARDPITGYRYDQATALAAMAEAIAEASKQTRTPAQ